MTTLSLVLKILAALALCVGLWPAVRRRLRVRLLNAKGEIVTTLKSGTVLTVSAQEIDRHGNVIGPALHATVAVSDPAVLNPLTLTGEKAGVATVTVSSPGLADGSAEVTVTPGDPAALVVTLGSKPPPNP